MSVRLFVGNLDYDVSEAELRELFAAAGAPVTVRIPTDRETGKPRGFAFVEYAERPQAEEAIRRFHQHVFKGRALAVNEARARGEAPPPPPAGAPFRPPRSSVSADPEPTEGAAPGQPRRTFGPDARPRDRRKREGRGTVGEREPKRPVRERPGGQLFSGADEEEGHDDSLDDFALWARADGTTEDED